MARLIIYGSSGVEIPASVDATELGFLDGVTSSIQTQLDAKAAASHNHVEADITNLDHYDSADFATDLAAADTGDLSEGSNLYYTEARVSANTSVAANTAKNSYPSADSTKLAGIESSADVTDEANVSSSGGMIVVEHGATASTSRPSVSGVVYWIGSVEPTNASNGDVWIDTS